MEKIARFVFKLLLWTAVGAFLVWDIINSAPAAPMLSQVLRGALAVFCISKVILAVMEFRGMDMSRVNPFFSGVLCGMLAIVALGGGVYGLFRSYGSGAWVTPVLFIIGVLASIASMQYFTTYKNTIRRER